MALENKSDSSKSFPYLALVDSIAFYPGEADTLLNRITDKEGRKQLEREFSYFRGEFYTAKKTPIRLDISNKYFICNINLIALEAIATGDLETFHKIYHLITEMDSKIKNSNTIKMLLHISAYSYLAAIHAVSEELDTQCLWGLNLPTRKAVYLVNSYYYFNINNYERVIGSLETIFSYQKNDQYSPRDIYICLHCGLAYYFAGNIKKAEYYINTALDLAIPDGFILPIAEFMLSYGTLLENILKKRALALYKKIVALSEIIWRNEVLVHNSFSKTLPIFVLTRKEMQVAILVKKGYTNKDISHELGCSLATVKKRMEMIFQKLIIKRRKELIQYLEY